MTGVWVILGTIGYFMIGSFICGLSGEEDFSGFLLSTFWPLAVVMFILGVVLHFPEKLGAVIRRAVNNRRRKHD